jgi:hypothetical protein
MMNSALPFISPASPRRQEAWLQALRRYLGFIVPAHLLWELAQLPLYTIWSGGSASEILFAVLHCTGGDALIAIAALILALVIAGTGWPSEREALWRVATITIFLGIGYTVFSEWLNTVVREAWVYSELMPVIPPLQTGLSPILQWIAVPVAAFWWARRPFAGARKPKEIDL